MDAMLALQPRGSPKRPGQSLGPSRPRTCLNLEASVEVETLKKVVLHSVATALASMVLPVPGGPNNSTPCIQSVGVATFCS